MKFLVLYDTRLALKNYKKGDEVEFAAGTDELFIKRLIDIGCIKPISVNDKKESEPTDKRGTKISTKQSVEQKAQPKNKTTAKIDDADDLDISDIDDE